MTRETRKQQIKQLCNLFECDQTELVGVPFRDLLADAEAFSGEIRIMWGSWTADDLDSNLVDRH